MESIVQKNTDRCFICGTTQWLEWHHIFGAANKKKSEKHKLMVRLCHFCHNEPPNGVHHNKAIRLKLKAYAQKKAMAHYGWDIDTFRKEFSRNYL
jgi:hypothetical protein